jgi:hypothetical protein
MLENTEINDLRITKLRTYLMSVISELIEQYGEMNINFLSKEPNNYSLDKIPVNPTQEQWIIGNFLNRDVYSFRSRVNYSADTMTNIENIGFFETFEKLIKQKNDNNILPDIDGIQSISCLNCGSLNNANTNTAEFDIQIQIEYREV